MLTRNVKSAVLAAIVLGAAGAGGAARADFTLSTLLAGANERPTPNASSATGSATITFASLTNTISYSLTFSGLAAPATAGHIHVGSANIAGPIILPFPGLSGVSGTFTGTLTAADLIPRPAEGINTFSDAVAAIGAGNAYVNVHNAVFPGGEIRGQLPAAPGSAVPEPGTLALLAGTGLLPLAGAVLHRRRSTTI